MGHELIDPHSAQVKRLRRLKRRDGRSAAGQFVAEGVNASREALTAHAADRAVVRELIVSSEARSRYSDVIGLAEECGISVTSASDAVLAAVSDTVTPQGIVAVVNMLDLQLSELLIRRPGLIAVLADVRDPGNAGSVIRAADAAGADGVVFAGESVDVYNSKVVRSSVGGLFHLPISCADAASKSVIDVMTKAREIGLQVLVADGSGEAELYTPEVDALLARPTAWVFGNESWGVPESVAAAADAVVRIPIYGRAESLNVATAAALCLYASARAQRQSGGDRQSS
ncbi:MAG: TrmH family RNA methyltransferase [Actinomycetes bacterium]